MRFVFRICSLDNMFIVVKMVETASPYEDVAARRIYL